MSRAFVKEDAEVAERSARRRQSSGLPPGALNYMTAAGEARWRDRLSELKSAGRDVDEVASLEGILASVTVVPLKPQPASVVFGSLVTVELADGTRETHRIVGVDEVEMDPVNVSWVSPIGKALLGAELGQRVTFPGEVKAVRRVVSIE